MGERVKSDSQDLGLRNQKDEALGSWAGKAAGSTHGRVRSELNTGHTEIPDEIPRENGKESKKGVLNIWLFNKYLLRTYLGFLACVPASGNSEGKQSLRRTRQARWTEILRLRSTGMLQPHRRGTSKCAREDFPGETTREHIQKDEQGLPR